MLTIVRGRLTIVGTYNIRDRISADASPHPPFSPSARWPTSSPSSTSCSTPHPTPITSAISPLDYTVQKTAVPRDRQQGEGAPLASAEGNGLSSSLAPQWFSAF